MKWLNVICILTTFLAYCTPFINPEQFWPIVFFGLSYPLLLVCNLLFILYWLLRKNWYALFSISVLAIGWGHVISIFGLHFSNQVPEKSTSFKVTTFNAHSIVPKGKVNKPENKVYDQFYDFVKRERADIYCFQEVVPFSLLYRKLPALKKDAFLKNFKSYGDEGSVKIYTHLPVLRHKSYFFNGRGINGFIWADLVWNEKVYRVFNIHMESNKISGITNPGKKKLVKDPGKVKQMLRRFKRGAQTRAQQALYLKNIISESPHPVIICGDFNDVPQSFTYQTLVADLTDTFKAKGHGFGFTYSNNLPGLRIDYILTSPSIPIADLTIGKRNFSDHKPVSGIFSKE